MVPADFKRSQGRSRPGPPATMGIGGGARPPRPSWFYLDVPPHQPPLGDHVLIAAQAGQGVLVRWQKF